MKSTGQFNIKEIEEIILLEEGIRNIGEKAKNYWRKGVKGKIKSSQYDIVTDADLILEKEIKTLITEKYSDAKMLGEESGGDIDNDYWTIDPIDGTSSFTAGLPTWSIALSHVQNNNFVFSMIYVPLGIDGPELYYAKKEKGSFLNGEKIQVSHTTDLKEANISLRSTEIREDHDGKISGLIKDSRMLWVPGSTSLALAHLAAGKLDVLFAKNQSIWDCPGTLLVTEAGGKVTFANIKNLDPKTSSRYTILATNGFLHERVFSHLKI